MQLGQVIGTVVATQIYEGMRGVPLLWVQPLSKEGKPAGGPVVCADATRILIPFRTCGNYIAGVSDFSSSRRKSWKPVCRASVHQS